MQGGQKIVQEFNHDHLVADLFMFIGSKVYKEIFKKNWSNGMTDSYQFFFLILNTNFQGRISNKFHPERKLSPETDF